MELFKQISIDWLSKKWYFFGFSWLLIALGVIGYITHGGLSYGIDFTGGTVIQIKFKDKPNLDMLRDVLKAESKSPPLIQQYGDPAAHEVQVRLQMTPSAEQGSMEARRSSLLTLLRQKLDPAHVDSKQTDFNNVGEDALYKNLLGSDPDNLRNQNKTTQEIDSYYSNMAKTLKKYRDDTRGGLVPSLDDLKSAGISSAVLSKLQTDYYAGPFAIKANETISAIVGSDLRRRATLAVGLSFLGMLVYVGFRFKPIYGVAAVVALFHDLAVTLGLFALTQKEISLTVIAALLTLVGYSMNDTIVVFDRVRENLRIVRKEPLYRILNLSINQTFARTLLTSFTTFVSVCALFLFGGEVLNGFSFALTVGILIGTYSSIAIASPIVEWWYRSIEQKSKRKAA